MLFANGQRCNMVNVIESFLFVIRLKIEFGKWPVKFLRLAAVTCAFGWLHFQQLTCCLFLFRICSLDLFFFFLHVFPTPPLPPWEWEYWQLIGISEISTLCSGIFSYPHNRSRGGSHFLAVHQPLWRCVWLCARYYPASPRDCRHK